MQCHSLHCKGSLETSLALDTPVSGASHNHDPDPATACVTKAKAAQTIEKPGYFFASKIPSRRYDT